jgi:flagellar biosynthetic protein FliR
MDWLSQIDVSRFLVFTLVLTRVSGLMVTAPVYGSGEIPPQVRALLAVTVAMLIMPGQWDVTIPDPGTTLNYAVLVGSELIVGLCLGLGITILFSGIQLAGQIIGRIGGLMLADVFDPSMGTSVPLFSRFLLLTSTAIFLLIGGHRMMLAGLLDTFASMPLGAINSVPASLDQEFLGRLVTALELLLTQSFSLGIRAAAPVVASLLLSTLVMGLISRTLPQLNIMAVGFGMNSMLTFGTLGIVMGTSLMLFQEQVEPAFDLILEVLHVRLKSTWLS